MRLLVDTHAFEMAKRRPAADGQPLGDVIG
jgi:hypothetical protein